MLSCVPAFAGGSQDEAETVALNNEWILCITEFDASSLPEDKRAVSEVFLRRLVSAVKTVSYRIRVSPEFAYYEDYAWSQARTAAAKALAAKQEERARLLYQGQPGWQYRQALKQRDAEIAKLQETLAEKEAEKPLINQEPAFALFSANNSGTFPAAPASGGEYRFCQTQKCDAFLTGEVQDFYGRYYVTLRLYVVYADSFVYEGDVIFSADDIESAVDEIAGRLTAVLAGSKPAAIAINAQPDDTLILINRTFAGRGTVEPLEIPQGTKTVAFSLEGYSPQTVETELVSGELTEISVTLAPQVYSDVNITVPEKTGTSVSVYQGAMYVGEAPLTIRLPLNQLDYINVYAKDGQEGEAVYSSPMIPDEIRTLSLKTKTPYPAGEKRVNKARYMYYWAWGGTWLTGIAAWLTYGIYTGMNSAMPFTASPEFYAQTNGAYYVSLGAVVLTGLAVIYEGYQMARYLFTATEKATPIVETEISK